ARRVRRPLPRARRRRDAARGRLGPEPLRRPRVPERRAREGVVVLAALRARENDPPRGGTLEDVRRRRRVTLDRRRAPAACNRTRFASVIELPTVIGGHGRSRREDRMELADAFLIRTLLLLTPGILACRITASLRGTSYERAW